MQSGSAFPLHNNEFGFAQRGAPGDDGSLLASIGTSYSTTIPYSVTRPQARHITAITRTGRLYIDRRSLRVGYAVTSDITGESRVSHTGLGLALTLQFDDGGSSATHTCSSLPDADTGIGECVYEVPTDQFDTASRRTVHVSISMSYADTRRALVR